MELPIFQELKGRQGAMVDQPGISIILPFEPKMSEKNELEYQLQRVVAKVQSGIRNKFPMETIKLLSDKLESLIRKLDFSTFKKSIAMYVSPQIEKLYYLDIAVEEKVIIDSGFEIRDLVAGKKDLHSFLLLVISAGRSRIYMGNTQKFIRISSVVPDHLNDSATELSHQESKNSDFYRRKEIGLDNFLRQVDRDVDIILNAYGLPLFVMGTYRAAAHFKKITHHADRIVGFISGNADEADEQKIKTAVTPHIADWKKVKQEDLLRQLNAAKRMNKLSAGIENVWKDANSKKGRLLVVEHNYSSCTWKVRGKQNNFLEKEVIDTPFLVEDGVDDIIEKVLENGGDVEFVEDGLLKDYLHIGLIRY